MKISLHFRVLVNMMCSQIQWRVTGKIRYHMVYVFSWIKNAYGLKCKMFLASFPFVMTIIILNLSASAFGDIVITIKSEEGAPRKYEFTVQSSQSQEEPHPIEDVSPHKPLTVYFPPSSTTSKPQTYSAKSKPIVHYNLPPSPLIKKKRPKCCGKGKRIRHRSRKSPWLNLKKSRPRSKVRVKKKAPQRRQNLFANIVRRYRGWNRYLFIYQTTN